VWDALRAMNPPPHGDDVVSTPGGRGAWTTGPSAGAGRYRGTC